MREARLLADVLTVDARPDVTSDTAAMLLVTDPPCDLVDNTVCPVARGSVTTSADLLNFDADRNVVCAVA